MRYYITYKFFYDESLDSTEEFNIYFRDKEDYFNTLYLCFILDKINKIKILDFGLCSGWDENEH